MSLADELLADLEENDREDETMDQEEESEVPEEKPDIKDVMMEYSTTQITSVRELCKLRDSHKLADIMSQIESYGCKIRKAIEIIGPVEADPEYQLIVEANNLAQDVDNEIGKNAKAVCFHYLLFRQILVAVHKFVRDKYQKRFPELESLVVSPLEYVKTVKELGNDLDQAKNNEILQQFLTQATIMVVSVTASTTQG